MASSDTEKLRKMDDRNRIYVPQDIADKFDQGQRFSVLLEGGKIVFQPVKVIPVEDEK